MKRPSLIFTAAALAVILAVCWSALAHDGEHHSPGGNGQANNEPMAAMGLTPCVNGMAGTFPCRDIDLASFLPLAQIGGGTGNDVWGWTDPLTAGSTTLLGRSSGISFVDSPTRRTPSTIGNLPTHNVDSLWRGPKVYRNPSTSSASRQPRHAGLRPHAVALPGRRPPRDLPPRRPHYNNFGSAHTIAVNEATGFVYVSGSRPARAEPLGDTSPNPRLSRRRLTRRCQEPLGPAFAVCVYMTATRTRRMRHLPRPTRRTAAGNLLQLQRGSLLTIVDGHQQSAPAQLSRTAYDNSNDGTNRNYAHQGWLTDDQTHFLLDDELDEQRKSLNTRTFIWDVTNLDAPFLRSVFQNQTTSIDHNLYIRGRYAYESNYRSGLRILDASAAPAGLLTESASYIYPITTSPRGVLQRQWANYPFSRAHVSPAALSRFCCTAPRASRTTREIDSAPSSSASTTATSLRERTSGLDSGRSSRPCVPTPAASTTAASRLGRLLRLIDSSDGYLSTLPPARSPGTCRASPFSRPAPVADA